ncbi:hypothetical protein HOG48_01045 [Candidatus Peregrinibacteria bacterium]|jgi:hypothetical protein|nr:hypothetical protein [Candidatus Peregrinibacteria bacterium]
MTSQTPSEGLEAEVNQAAHMGRVVERAGHINTLQQLLGEEDKAAVLTALEEKGFRFEEGFEAKELPAIQEAIREAITTMQADQPAGLATAIEKGLIGASEVIESGGVQPQLDESLRANLEAMRQDFNGGIVLIGDDTTPEQYTDALAADKTAGQTWESVEARLLSNDAELLKKAAELPEGGRLIGVYSNGELAIRQRSQEIVNARWTKNWKDGDADKGELRLLSHAEAMAQETGRWAKAVEILRAVKAEGFHVPADSPDYSKKGLVAASDAVTKADYVRSPNGDEWRSAILECRDDVTDNEPVRVVYFALDDGSAVVGYVNAYFRADGRGAVLWLRG